jgi:hypothetical protein
MTSVINEKGFLEFATNDSIISRLKELHIEWDEAEVLFADISLHDNTYQTRFDAGGADEEYVIRYKNYYRDGNRLPMPLVALPYSSRNQRDAKVSPCCGRHRLEGAMRAGATSGRVIRALPKEQGDIDALRDLSMFDNMNNGKSVSINDQNAYCADEVIRKHGGEASGMPDKKFLDGMFRRWPGKGVSRETVSQHIRAKLAKYRCNAFGFVTPAGHIELFARLWSWESQQGFQDLSKAVCRCFDDADVREILNKCKKRKSTAAATLAEITIAAKGYRTKGDPLDAASEIRLRCDGVRKALEKLKTDMSVDYDKLHQVEDGMEALWSEAQEIISHVRAKIGGLLHV